MEQIKVICFKQLGRCVISNVSKTKGIDVSGYKSKLVGVVQLDDCSFELYYKVMSHQYIVTGNGDTYNAVITLKNNQVIDVVSCEGIEIPDKIMTKERLLEIVDEEFKENNKSEKVEYDYHIDSLYQYDNITELYVTCTPKNSYRTTIPKWVWLSMSNGRINNAFCY